MTKKVLNDELIIQLYNENKSLNQIAQIIEVDRATIKSRLLTNNITILRHRKWITNSKYFDSLNKNSSYWLGFLMADGYNSGDFIRIDIMDEGHLEKLRDDIFLKRDAPIRIKKHSETDKNVYYITIQDKLITNRLEQLGIVRKKSHIATYPDDPNLIDNHFIRGLFDGDGSLSFTLKGNYRKYMFSIVGSENLLKCIKDKITKLGINVGFSKCKSIFRIYVCGNQQILKLLDWIYKDSDVYLDRKYEKYKELRDYNLNRKKRN
jgi:hypothetical protein